MRLTVVGCSGSLPGPDSPASCYLLEVEGFRVAIDLGSGATGPLQRHCALHDLDAVLISHLHADHCMDLVPLYVARTHDPDRVAGQLPVYGPAGSAEHMVRAYGPTDGPGLPAVFGFVEWRSGTQQIGPLTVTAAQVAHPVPTWAMRIEHGGRTLVYSADTGPCDGLVDLAEGADLLLCEAAFQDGQENPPDLHLTGREAGEHAARAGINRMVLTHIPPWHDPARTLDEAGSSFDGALELARSDALFEV
jgi:ribonuclease BN (tRNA processing enzyme)